MLNNIIVGPMVLFNDYKMLQYQVNNMFTEGWLSLCIVIEGEFLDSMKSTMPKQQQKLLKGILFTIGFHKPYLA